jgi:hypothetical protein
MGSGNLDTVQKIKFAFKGLEKVGNFCPRKLWSWKGGEIHQGDEKAQSVCSSFLCGYLGTKIMRLSMILCGNLGTKIMRWMINLGKVVLLHVLRTEVGGLQWGSFCHLGSWFGSWNGLDIFLPQSVPEKFCCVLYCVQVGREIQTGAEPPDLSF